MDKRVKRLEYPIRFPLDIHKCVGHWIAKRLRWQGQAFHALLHRVHCKISVDNVVIFFSYIPSHLLMGRDKTAQMPWYWQNDMYDAGATWSRHDELGITWLLCSLRLHVGTWPCWPNWRKRWPNYSNTNLLILIWHRLCRHQNQPGWKKCLVPKHPRDHLMKH